MGVIEFRTLGTLDLRAADGRELHSLLAQPKRVALLAYLCIAQPPGYHRRDTLLGLFWPDADQEHARTSLRKSIHILRRALGEDSIISRGDEEVAVDRSRISCDVTTFYELARTNRLDEALELYRGDLLPGFFVDDAPEFEQWLQATRSQLRLRAAQTAYAAAERLEKNGDPVGAVRFARRSLDLAGTDERALRKLITLQSMAGDRAAAIETYDAFVRSLASDYQTEPSAESRSVIEQIREGSEALAHQPAARPGSALKHSGQSAVGLAVSSPGRTTETRSATRRYVFAAVGLVLILGGFASSFLRSPPSKQVLRFTLVVDSTEPLWRALPFATRLAISPDGSRLAYISGSRNGPDAPLLRIREWNALHAASVPGTEEALSPFFSPDGRSVGFLRQQSVWIASPPGPPIQVSDSLSGIAGASWGPDGFIYVDGFESKPLARVKAKQGSAAKWFTALDTTNGEIDHMWPNVLPNGKGVLFTVAFKRGKRFDRAAPLAVALADIPTGKHRIIIQDATYPVYVSSGHVLYVTAQRKLMMVPFDQNSMTVTGPATALLDSMRLGTFGATDLAVSSTGTLVYAVGAGLSQYQSELLWVGHDGKATPVDPEWHGMFQDPAISPDGKLLAISKSPDGQGGDVWIKQLDKGPATRLTQERIYNGSPTWRPDGRSVTFLAPLEEGPYQLWTQRADGTTEAVKIPRAENVFHERWSPDGKWLVFEKGEFEGPTALDIVGLRPGVDTSPVPLVAGKYVDAMPEISPDGRWLAYQSDETGLYQIYVVPFPNTKAGKWAVTTAGGIHVRWGRRGDELFYRDTSGDFFSVPVRGSSTFASGTPKRLFPAKRIEFPLAGYAVSPDDRLITIRLLNAYLTDKIVVVENWFDELEKRK